MLGQKTSRTRQVSVVVVGLGRFGGAVAASLSRQGIDVLGIDADAEIVQKWSNELEHVVQLDATHDEALAQVGIGEFDRAVVAIGNDVEASVLSAVALVEAGVPEIWAKAVSRKHGRILAKMGVQHVIYPDWSMGERVAHVVGGGMIDYMGFEDDFALARTRAPRETWDRTLAESVPRSRHGVTIVGLKRPSEDFTYARPDTQVLRGDELIVSGQTARVEAFCALSDLPA